MVDFASASLLTLILIGMGASLVLMIVIPVLPGQFGIWLSALLYAFATGWDRLGLGTFLVLTLLTLLATIIDQIAGWWGARRGGASWQGIVAGLLGGLIGLIIFNAIGAVLGFIVGMTGYEYNQTQDWAHTWRTVKGYLLGQLASLIIRLGIAVLMIAIFWFSVT